MCFLINKNNFYFFCNILVAEHNEKNFDHEISIAFVAQLGERMTEDHKVRGSIPRGGTFLFSPHFFSHFSINRS